ncbi:MAG: preprotein translocase subunit SecE [Actinomycetota bacterium]
MSDPSSLNRQTRRFAQKQGLLDDDGEPVRQSRGERGQQRRVEPRTPPAQFFREVRSELSKVVWPSREEVINYSLVVFTLLVAFTGLVAALDFGLGEAIVKLFER